MPIVDRDKYANKHVAKVRKQIGDFIDNTIIPGINEFLDKVDSRTPDNDLDIEIGRREQIPIPGRALAREVRLPLDDRDIEKAIEESKANEASLKSQISDFLQTSVKTLTKPRKVKPKPTQVGDYAAPVAFDLPELSQNQEFDFTEGEVFNFNEIPSQFTAEQAEDYSKLMLSEMLPGDALKELADIMMTDISARLPRELKTLPVKMQAQLISSEAEKRKRVLTMFSQAQRHLIDHYATIQVSDLDELRKKQLNQDVEDKIKQLAAKTGISVVDYLGTTFETFGRATRALIAPLHKTLGLPKIKGGPADIPKILWESSKPTFNIVASPFGKHLTKNEEFLRGFDYYEAIKSEPMGIRLSDLMPILYSPEGEGVQLEREGPFDLSYKGFKGFMMDLLTNPVSFVRGIPLKGPRVTLPNGRIVHLNKDGARLHGKFAREKIKRLPGGGSKAENIIQAQREVDDIFERAIVKNMDFAERVVEKPGIQLDLGLGLKEGAPRVRVPLVKLPKLLETKAKQSTGMRRLIEKYLYAQHGLEKTDPKIAKTFLELKNMERFEKDKLIQLAKEASKYNSPEVQAEVMQKMGEGFLRQLNDRDVFSLVAKGNLKKAIDLGDEETIQAAKQWMRKKPFKGPKDRALAVQSRKFAITREFERLKGRKLMMDSEDAQQMYEVMLKMGDSKNNIERVATQFPEYDKSLAYINWLPGMRSDTMHRYVRNAMSLDRLQRISGKSMTKSQGKVLNNIMQLIDEGKEIPDPLMMMFAGQSRFLRDFWRTEAALKVSKMFGHAQVGKKASAEGLELMQKHGIKTRFFPTERAAVDAGYKKLKLGSAKQPVDVWLPEKVADRVKPIFDVKGSFFGNPMRDISELGKLHPQGIAGAYDDLTAIWASWVTVAFPTFHTRNAVTEMFNSYLDRGLGAFLGHGKAKALRAGKKFKIAAAGGQEFDSGAVLDLLQRNGIVRPITKATKFSTDDLDDVINFAAHGSLARTRKALTQNPIIKAGRSVQVMMDEHMKVATFLHHLQRSGSVDTALDMTRRFHADYQNLLNGFERRVVRRMFPFYSFTKFNFPLQFSSMVKEPLKFFLPIKALEGMRREMSDAERQTEPPWLKGQAVIPIDYNNGQTRYMVVGGPPFTEAMGRFFAVDQDGNMRLSSSALKAVGSMLNPAMKAPLELIMNKSLFFGSKIYESKPGERGVFRKGPRVLKQLPDAVKQFAKIREVVNKSSGEVDIYVEHPTTQTLLYLLQQSFMGRALGESSRFMTEGEYEDWNTAIQNLVLPMKSVRVHTQRRFEDQMQHDLRNIDDFIRLQKDLALREEAAQGIEEQGEVFDFSDQLIDGEGEVFDFTQP